MKRDKLKKETMKYLAFAKVEVQKGSNFFMYTGDIFLMDNDHYYIETIKKEQLIFKMSSVVQIRMLEKKKWNETQGWKD